MIRVMLASEAMENRRPIRHFWGDGLGMGDGESLGNRSVSCPAWCRALPDDFLGEFGEATEVHTRMRKTNVWRDTTLVKRDISGIKRKSNLARLRWFLIPNTAIMGRVDSKVVVSRRWRASYRQSRLNQVSSEKTAVHTPLYNDSKKYRMGSFCAVSHAYPEKMKWPVW